MGNKDSKKLKIKKMRSF